MLNRIALSLRLFDCSIGPVRTLLRMSILGAAYNEQFRGSFI